MHYNTHIHEYSHSHIIISSFQVRTNLESCVDKEDIDGYSYRSEAFDFDCSLVLTLRTQAVLVLVLDERSPQWSQ